VTWIDTHAHLDQADFHATRDALPVEREKSIPLADLKT